MPLPAEIGSGYGSSSVLTVARTATYLQRVPVFIPLEKGSSMLGRDSTWLKKFCLLAHSDDVVGHPLVRQTYPLWCCDR